MTFVRTIRGDIAPEEMGTTNAHDHLIRSGGGEVMHDPDHLLDSVDKAVEEAARFLGAGGTTIVDMCPVDCGRDIKKLLEANDRLPDLKGGNVVFGAQQNPLITWEEEFTQYRFVYLSPWNFLGLSSSQIGLAFNGPLKLNGSEKTYLDYSAGVFDNGNYRNQEQSNTKQVMARITAFPFGSTWRYQGLGLTGL